MLGCPPIAERITYRPPEYARAAPWEIFCLASKLDVEEVAKLAIRHFGHVDFKLFPPDIPLVKAEACRLPYLLGLFRAMAETSGTFLGLERPQMDLQINYSDASKRFEPVRQ
jgi:hypothetical protein